MTFGCLSSGPTTFGQEQTELNSAFSLTRLLIAQKFSTQTCSLLATAIRAHRSSNFLDHVGSCGSQCLTKCSLRTARDCLPQDTQVDFRYQETMIRSHLFGPCTRQA